MVTIVARHSISICPHMEDLWRRLHLMGPQENVYDWSQSVIRNIQNLK